MNPTLHLPINELKPALTGLGKVINPKAALAVLKTIKVERTADGWICLTATDLDHFATVRLEQPAKGDPMTVLVPYDQFLKLAKSASKGETVQLEPVSETDLILRFNLGSQLGETKISVPPVTEFPDVPKVKGTAIAVADDLRRALHEALACVSDDPTRYVIQGACIDVSDQKAHYVVGTNGRHLYSCNSFQLPLQQSLIIPRHKFLVWKEFNFDGDWRLKVPVTAEEKTPEFIQISSRRWRYLTRLIDGNYPNWKQVLPDDKAAHTRLQFDPQQLEANIDLLRRLPIYDERHETVGVEFKEHQCSVLARASLEDPWTRVPLAGCQGQGRDVTVFVDRRYLTRALDFGLTSLGVIDEGSSLKFHAPGKQMVVMPVRVPEYTGTVAPARAAIPSTPAPTPEPAVPLQTQVPAQTDNPTPEARPKDAAASAALPTAPTIEALLADIHDARETLQQGVNKLRDVSLKLKAVHRGQRTSERELQSVKSTLLSLQRVRL